MNNTVNPKQNLGSPTLPQGVNNVIKVGDTVQIEFLIEDLAKQLSSVIEDRKLWVLACNGCNACSATSVAVSPEIGR